jgi:23S rRNA pseudouridine1911/1915/1917 synthase
LHATELGFEHPVTGKKLHFSSPLPDDLGALVEALETAH